MDDEVVRTGFILVLIFSFGAIAILIQRRSAKIGAVAILAIMPFLYLFGIVFIEGEVDVAFERFSNELVVGVLASIIGGLILLAIRKNK